MIKCYSVVSGCCPVLLLYCRAWCRFGSLCRFSLLYWSAAVSSTHEAHWGSLVYLCFLDRLESNPLCSGYQNPLLSFEILPSDSSLYCNRGYWCTCPCFVVMVVFFGDIAIANGPVIRRKSIFVYYLFPLIGHNVMGDLCRIDLGGLGD